MLFTPVHWIEVIVAAILSLALGYAWYSNFLFAKTWMKVKNLKEEDLKNSGSAMGITVVTSLVAAYILALIKAWSGVDTYTDAVFLALTVTVFIGTFTFHGVVFDRADGMRNRAIDWLIHLGYILIWVLLTLFLYVWWK